MSAATDLKKLLRELLRENKTGEEAIRRPKENAGQRTPLKRAFLLSAIAAAGDQAGTEVSLGGEVLRLSTSSHASCKLEVAFEQIPGRGENWFPIVPGGKLTPPRGGRFESFRVRKQTGTPSTSNSAIFIVDTSEDGTAVDESPHAGNVSAGGRTEIKMGLTDATGAETDVIGTQHGAVGVAGFDGADYQRVRTDTTGRPIVVGAAAAGAAIAGNPILNGLSDGTNARAQLGDTSGRAQVVGAAAAGAAIAGNPVQVGGSDGTNARALKTSTTGALKASAGFGVETDDTITRIPPTASDGTNDKELLALSGGTTIYVLTLIITTDAARTVYLMSNATPRWEIYLPAAGTFILDGRGDMRTAAGEALKFKLDGGTKGTRVSGTAVQK